MPDEMKRYTIAAIYDENDQRYGPDSLARNPTEAAIDAVRQAREDNHSPDETITICAIFEGEHECVDTTVMYAGERPEVEAESANEMRDFTVVTGLEVVHVRAVSAIAAERAFDEETLIAGVFAGHLVDLSHEIDYDRYETATAVLEEVEA